MSQQIRLVIATGLFVLQLVLMIFWLCNAHRGEKRNETLDDLLPIASCLAATIVVIIEFATRWEVTNDASNSRHTRGHTCGRRAGV